VRYGLGVFTNEDAEAAAEGFFVHVFVDRHSKRPTPIPERFRAHFEHLS
jgi:acyl-CoA thioester hydrolase